MVSKKPTIQHPIHIGKASCGWLFNFQEADTVYCGKPIAWHTYNQVKSWLEENTTKPSSEFVIMDEYDRLVECDELLSFIQERQTDERSVNNPDNFTHSKNIDGYRFTLNDFS